MPWMKASTKNRPVAGDRVRVPWWDNVPRLCTVIDVPQHADKKKMWVLEREGGGRLEVGMRQMEFWREEP